MFAGSVLHVFDGRTFCVAQGSDPSKWIHVTLAGETRGVTRADLMAAIFAKKVVCRADHADRGGVAARCVLDEVPLGLLVNRSSIRAEAADWR